MRLKDWPASGLDPREQVCSQARHQRPGIGSSVKARPLLTRREAAGRSAFDLEIARRSHPGRVRAQNEDSVRTAPAIGLAILADGLGGYNAGEVASDMATDMLHRNLSRDLGGRRLRPVSRGGEPADLHRLIRRRVGEVNQSIHRLAHERRECLGMATTLVMALFNDQRVTVAHVGDSRLYRLRERALVRITRDHSLLQEQLDEGILTPEEAEDYPDKNLVTRALGAEPEVVVDIDELEVRADDVYLLCSDGLTDMLAESEIRDVLLAHPEAPEVAAEDLLDTGNERGGFDNISLILISVRPAQPRPSGTWAWIAERVGLGGR